MGAADFLIPPSLDPNQALRLRRFGLAALSYPLATALVAAAWAFGVLPAAAALQAVAAFAAINAGLYLVIRSGLNLRFADPSLTRIQILIAMTVLMYIVYHMDEGRNIALFGAFIVFLFGIFRLRVREFTVIVLYSLAAYALVIDLLMYLRPQAIRDVHLDWMSWLMLAGFLPCFVFIGGHINALRRSLRDKQAQFRSLTEMSTDFYWESDAGHRVTVHTFADPRSGIMPAFGPAVPIGVPRWEIPYLSPDEAGWRAHRTVLDAHEPFRDFEFSRRGIDGTERFLSINGDPLFDRSGVFVGYRGVGADITERKRSEAALRDSAEKLRLFADNVPAMTASYDENLRCVFANMRYAVFFGQLPADIVGKHLREIVGEGAYGEIEGHFAQVLRGHPVTYRRTHKLRDGESRHIESKLVPHAADDGKAIGCFAVTTDITEQMLAEERIQRVAHHDSLTGLPNRLLFNDRLGQAIGAAKRNATRFALLYLDLDRFKPVNDTLGHVAGDELLQAVAARIRRQVRESDTVARVGGDEFTVILADIGARGEAETVAGKIVAALAAPCLLGEGRQSVNIGTSIGIAVYPEDALDADGLVKAADAAMYDAKKTGGSVCSARRGDNARMLS